LDAKVRVLKKVLTHYLDKEEKYDAFETTIGNTKNNKKN